MSGIAIHGSEPQNTRPSRGRTQYLREYAAFVNLEATGSYGPDVVFRANSEVLLGSYVKRAPRPRATVIAQDIFGSGAVPSDTDYSVLGGQNFGQLTGMDLATMLDSRSYHCDRDTYDRIERGSIQAYGENLMAVIEEASLRLRRAEEKGRKSTGWATWCTLTSWEWLWCPTP